MVDVTQCHGVGEGICPWRVWPGTPWKVSYDWNTPKISKGRGWWCSQLRLKDLFYLGVVPFPKVFLVLKKMQVCYLRRAHMCPLVSKESGDSGWYHQKVDNLWLQIYLSYQAVLRGNLNEWDIIWRHVMIDSATGCFFCIFFCMFFVVDDC